MPRISLGTVYRNLKNMAAEGKILELVLKPESRFDWNNDGHCHFHCRECNCIMDVGKPLDNDTTQMISAGYDLEITHHRLDFYGLCPACRDDKEEQ